MTKIQITTTDKNFANDLKAANIEGLNINPRIFFRDSVDATPLIDEALKFTLTVVVPVALPLFTKWLCKKIKGNKKDKIVVNGNVIHADTVNIIQITQIINGDNTTKKH